MDIATLLGKCQEAIKNDPINAGVVLVVPRPANGKRVKLSPAKGAPFGEILQCYEDRTVAMFDAREVRNWVMCEIDKFRSELDADDRVGMPDV